MHTPKWVEPPPTADELVNDRGLQFGDGVFETMAWTGERLRYLERHFARLADGCERLGLPAPSADTLAAESASLALPGDACVVKLIITRGAGGRGYAPPDSVTPRHLWLTRPWPRVDDAVYRDGLRVAWLDTTLARQPRLAGVKHLNRLEQVLGARELASLEADDGLLCDEMGHVVEALSSNLFCVRDGALHTPLLDYCGVRGVMRQVVLDTAERIGVAAHEWPLRRADVALADEIFLTSAIRGIVPVAEVGNLRPGRVGMARRLSQALADDGVRQCA